MNAKNKIEIDSDARKTEKKLSKKDEKILELTSLLQHVQADFENYKKRIEAEKISLIRNSNRGLIAELLPILDSFELALKNKKEKKEFVKGVELIYSQLNETLKREGLKRIETGERFNPELHEALMQKESNQENGTILEELQRGYMLNGLVIRPSRVMIAKKAVQNEIKTKKNPVDF